MKVSYVYVHTTYYSVKAILSCLRLEAVHVVLVASLIIVELTYARTLTVASRYSTVST